MPAVLSTKKELWAFYSLDMFDDESGNIGIDSAWLKYFIIYAINYFHYCVPYAIIDDKNFRLFREILR